MTGVTADRVIVEIEASTGKARADMAVYERMFGRSMLGIERSALHAEKQFRSSAAGISSSLKGLAASFAAGFSAQQVAKLADSYTRFTNQLKVAGLEGDALAKQQQRLFEIAQQNGVEVEALGTLYSRAARNSKELGASQGELAQFTQAVAAGLRINNTSVTEASGALLQLGQALGSPRVQMEEFGSLIDGMTPLLQAASKYIDGTGGSLAGLTQKLKDTKGPGVSNVQLFQAIVKAQAELDAQAAKTTLTIGASFQTLNNALGKYIGETDQALSATQRISHAIGLIADNLDSVIPALGVLAAVLGVRYVTAAGLATASTIANAVANVRAAQTAAAHAAAQVRLAGLMQSSAVAANLAAASVTRLSVAQGVAARGLGALTALAGGPAALGLMALGAAIYYVATQSTAAEAAAASFTRGEQRAAEVTQAAASATDKLATAHGKARVEALALARAEAELVKQKLASARASLVEAQAEAFRQSQARPSNAQSAGSPVGAIARGTRLISDTLFPASAKTPAGRRADELKGEIAGYQKRVNELMAAINAPAPGVANVGAGDSEKKKGGRGASGKTAAEIAREHADAMSRLTQEELQAQLALTDDAEERAAISFDLLAEEYKQREIEIANNKDFTTKQKAAQSAVLKKLYGVGGLDENGDIIVDANAGLLGKAVSRERQQQLEREAADLAEARHRAASDALQIQFDLATTEAERKRIALAILEADRQYLKSKLDAVIDSKTASQAEKDRARVASEALQASGPGEQKRVANQHRSPLEEYLAQTDPSRNAERAEQLVVEEIDHVKQGISSALSKALGTDDPLITGLINLLLEQVLFRPLAEALQGGASGGGGGLLGGLLSGVGSIFGFASGGSMQIGGRGGNDNNTLSLNGRPIANVERGETLNIGRKALSGRGGGTTVISSPQFDLRGAVVTPQLYADMERISRANAAEAGQKSYHQSMRDAPVAVRNADRYGR